ncbi:MULTISPECIES: acyl-CoA dehydrogenase family protein [unclassified Algoriphagus]|jgi:alkylation response protein AidB-like acyl-CoA dehydrogenase|uniref:acyl-CoA dehydrogenase family protein n=2 Tax=Algoriphagus TaxID=246875 RepID=UPI000C68B1CB|nr:MULTISPECIES: acyl-CoA dehydrogenase family protein [unclassified Algoriphagus]MAL15904.1 acyl-CoA dehydrogenase [Algoriphagus sp.]MAN87101.1 acyl-CoA dehydrogenase [Algoriphagus sp.]HAH36074.1 acyl-CoA dehydrogenase [Algoriphagus sp.]HAS57614.1 acyl-CoA dehydrogenase [Algoriphagus sp.]HCH43369.1 acyl-CoA dehydrogenase [Algoriphagus sp.]|tara:strand:- start:3155 stop:4300 length:1146 start_codon:yes stop_codon:yes gene_type:complete
MLNFTMNENQRMIADMIRDFGAKEITPFRKEWDDNQHFPLELFKKLGELGLMGVLVPTEYGGSGFTYFEYVTAIAELSKLDPSVGLSMAAHNSLCTGHIMQFGNEEQKKKYLPKLATCEWLGAWGLTEPNTGSDAGNMRTVAKKEGEYYIINGAKNFITHGVSGDVAVVIARTGEVGDSHGMTAFVVEKGTPGFRGGRKEDKLGMRASETAEMIFEDCKVHESQVLGEVGDGFIQSMKILDGGRISIAALSLGIAQGALEASIQYSQERQQFNQPISRFQGISFKLADMATQVEAASLLTFKAADLKNRGEKVTLAGAQAKYYASEVAVSVSNEAVQIFGGYGFTKDYPVEKYYRDSKLCTIGEGTSEIQKLVISREVLKK